MIEVESEIMNHREVSAKLKACGFRHSTTDILFLIFYLRVDMI